MKIDLDYIFSRCKVVGKCLEWQGYKVNGYGKMNRGRTHRIVYTMIWGEIPEGMIIMHTCDNRACCNPAHLVMATQKDNLADMEAKGHYHNRKLTESQVQEIGRKHANGMTFRALAIEYDVHSSTVFERVKKASASHLSASAASNPLARSSLGSIAPLGV